MLLSLRSLIETALAVSQGDKAQQEGISTGDSSSASAIFVPQVTEIVAFLDAVGAVALSPRATVTVAELRAAVMVVWE